MAWKGVHINRPARLSWRDGHLVVAQDDGETRLPLEDVAWIVLDGGHATLTASLVSACMAAGIALVFTDERHTPSGLALPFHRHHRQAAVAGLQTGLSQPAKKRLWQALVVAKIENQAAALNLCRPGEDSPLMAMARLVGSGDPDNVEARAARDYWKRLFPAFVREDAGDRRNAMLNYGYAVVRAAVARALVASGFLPCFGLHHDSATNAFNLADDLFEPFRPFVDRLVFGLSDGGERRDGEMTVDDRRALAGALNADAVAGAETVSLLTATEKAAESLVRAIEANAPALLVLPRFGDDGG